MGNISNSFDDENICKLRNTAEVTNLVIQAGSLGQASELLARHLKQFSCRLLFAGKYDANSIQHFDVIYSAFSSELKEMCTHFDGKQGCPLVQIAIRSGRSFDALDLYLEGFDDFFTMRYFKALKKLGFEKISVIPIFADESVYVFFVGVASAQVYNLLHHPLHNAISQFIAASIVKFTQAPNPCDETRTGCRITSREKECLTWTALGKTSDEISTILDLSEHTVNAYLASVSAKLNASNRVHAVVKAIGARVIDPEQLLSR